MLEAVAIYLATGLLAGFVSGLFGVGGAFTMTPALTPPASALYPVQPLRANARKP